MSNKWNDTLYLNPIPSLLAFGDQTLAFFTRRDLMDESHGTPAQLWSEQECQTILAKQNTDGSWLYPRRKNSHPTENYHLLQTFRNLGYLIEIYGMDRSQVEVSRAAEYLLNHQSDEGDIRGIFGSHYAPHYTAGILELLIKAGYKDDARVHKAFHWYGETHQDDGGWAWPLRTSKTRYQDAIEMENPVISNYSKPFSHALTGFVIRAYAAHPDYRDSPDAIQAGKLLKSRFFISDKYVDRKAAEYWFKFQYPFWWGNLLTALDSLSLLNFDTDDSEVKLGLSWFISNQKDTGLWPTGYGKGNQADRSQGWVSLAVCRVLKRFHKE
jgi:hypothetical protein